MDSNSGMWNPQQNPQFPIDPHSSLGPMYQHMRYPPPPLQPYQNFPNQYFPYPSMNYPPPPLPPPSVPPPFTHSVPPPQLDTTQFYSAPYKVGGETQQLEIDEEWVVNWLSQRSIQPSSKNTPPSNIVKLMDIHSLLFTCSSAIKELRKLHSELSALPSCGGETKWDSLQAEVNKKKAALALLLSKVRTLDLAAIEVKLSKRARKRGRLRRKRAKVKELKQAELARRKMLHQRADAWLAEMRLTVEREHREEELRREADAVLGEVTRKQTEAKRQIGLLNALIKLRQVRAQRSAMHSLNQDAESGHSAEKFATVIERLRALWETQLKEYSGEERGLRVMLNESAAQKSDARCQRVKSTIDLWHKAIFGQSASHMPFKKDINGLISVRAAWDRYVIANAPMASSIPVGWVLPQEPSSDLWRSYCVAYDKGD